MLTVEGKNFDWKNIGLAECLRGNAIDSYFTLKIYHKLRKEIESLGLVKLYDKLIAPLTVLFRDLESDGILIDPAKLASLKKDIGSAMSRIESEVKSLDRIPPECNLASNDDLIKIFYSLRKSKEGWVLDDSYGYGLYPPSRTKAGQPQTDEETLKTLKDLIDEEVVRRKLNVQ